MTGYQAKLVPYIRDPSNAMGLLDATNLEIPDIVVIDGHRVDLGDFYKAVASEPLAGEHHDEHVSNGVTFRLYRDALTFIANLIATNQTSPYNASRGKPYPAYEVTNDGMVYLPYQPPSTGKQEMNFSFRFASNITSISQISTNITLYNDSIPHTSILLAPPLDVLLSYDKSSGGGPEQNFWAGSTMFNATWLAANSVCQPGNAYYWGFSAGMLMVFAGSTGVYAVLMVAVYWFVHENGRADRYRRDVSVYRDVLDLADELKAQLGGSIEKSPGGELDAMVRDAGAVVKLDMEGLMGSRVDEKRLRKRRGKAESEDWRLTAESGQLAEPRAPLSFSRAMTKHVHSWKKDDDRRSEEEVGHVEDVSSAKQLL
ncbi:hypothetical protein LTS10_009347 [Elasticomyces elasticus]|nr:hypothetical protein LTS10_009347 [Elasticomyces elasticus]